MAWNETLTKLNYYLADRYPFQDQTVRLVRAAGIPLAFIRFNPAAIDNWYAILVEADNRNRVMDLIQAVLIDNPDDPILKKAIEGQLEQDLGPKIKEDDWKNPEPADTLEKLIGSQSTLLPISFLEKGLIRSRSVARVVLGNGTLGSGFLTKGNIFITNHHVFHDAVEAKTAKLQFNYQRNSEGLDLQPSEYQLNPDDGFLTSEEDDWSLTKVNGDPNQDWGAIDIRPVEVKAQDFVNIIQHPAGDRKQIALYHNLVAFANDKRIQYLTDTLPGSSGSPVFNTDWRVVALHHSGGWLVEPGTKKTYYRNEGIHINLIYEALKNSEFYPG